jgi:hypothetical protein
LNPKHHHHQIYHHVIVLSYAQNKHPNGLVALVGLVVISPAIVLIIVGIPQKSVALVEAKGMRNPVFAKKSEMFVVNFVVVKTGII